MRKYRLPPIRDEPWDGDEKAKILVMNIYEMEVFSPKGERQNSGVFKNPRIYCTLAVLSIISDSDKTDYDKTGFCRF